MGQSSARLACMTTRDPMPPLCRHDDPSWCTAECEEMARKFDEWVKRTAHNERCEWNPVHHCAALDPPRTDDCQNVTSVCLGAGGKWHVCETCAKDPAFNRYKKRTPLPATKMGS